ncbi:3-hydroxyacyl-CoA dehydrogenase family protein [Defluviimonas sp. SAOS-178_SWC]|uniref:3-hydroxyacyl-CoA dehydrogenase family protein n=1 Tax=Defluviimonas sp. SAOS-178_SWC TaxID=3121287 RepID=UPI003221515A
MVSSIAIIGAGTMGAGIALNAARHGFDVVLLDRTQDSLNRAGQKIAKQLQRHEQNGVLDRTQAFRCRSRMRLTTDIAEIREADIVVEAVFEDLAVKMNLLRDIRAYCAEGAVVATNTSALRVSELAKAVAHPGNLLGMHYFSPADTSPVVELVQGEKTSPKALEIATAFLEATGRRILRCKDAPGFAINRFFVPFLNAAAEVVHQGGGTIRQVNEVGRDLVGSQVGPFEVMNLIKPEIARNAMANLTELGAFYTVSQGLIDLVERGGLWDVESGGPSNANEDSIRERLLEAIAVPAEEVRRCGIADPEEIDRSAVIALRWSRGPYQILAENPARPEGQQVFDRVRPRYGEA